MSDNIYYVYEYLRHTKSVIGDVGSPYYVGKGKKNRAYTKHTNIATPKNKDNIRIVSEKLSEEDAHILEVALISHYGRVNTGTGILRNLTDGGEGTSGAVRSLEYREKQRITKTGKKHNPETIQKISGENHHMYGKTHSQETLDKMIAAKTGENNPKGMLGKTHSQETINKMVLAQTGEKNHMYGETQSAESNKLRSDALKGDKSYMFGKTHSEDVKAKISLATSGENHHMYGKKQDIVECPYCKKTGGRTMYRWHFDNCKQKDIVC